ncbi:MAG TPA: AAA family ATPase, partial [Candidatus Dormibacteraeota bacterium]|nr:AAA family ATPase [Candidatus Dormibacteraeota bacterium]
DHVSSRKKLVYRDLAARSNTNRECHAPEIALNSLLLLIFLRRKVARLGHRRLLEGAGNDCDTTWITRKAGDVAKLVITDRLRSAFAANLSRLGFNSAPVEMKLGPGSVGQYPYHVGLMARPDVPPAEILSEGERTCVALAGFLAELETSQNLSSIVLDDPVSSLDHHYRVRVARLLVESAKLRQVVVFTHDIVFLLMLSKYAQKAGIPLRECSLLRGVSRHGIPAEGPPWVAMRVSRRIGVLRNELQTAEALLRKGDRQAYEQKTEWIYKRLRESWERAVEEVLLDEVVLRFGDGIATQRLKKLTDITDSDVQTVDTEMTYCSSFVHDESGAVNAGIPEPPAVQSDIQRLDAWIISIKQRRK